MVESTLKVADPGAAVRMVTASRGKVVRAEPVSALYQAGRVVRVGMFAEPETEMTSWVPGDPDSPNRVDALVWALTGLLVTPPATFAFAEPDPNPRRFARVAFRG